MGARQTKNELMNDEWEFDMRNELATAVEKEAHVCGDEVRWLPGGNVAEIYNFHQSSVRWKGTVAGVGSDELTEMKNRDEEAFTVTLTRGEVELLREGDGTDIEAVISDILRQVKQVPEKVTSEPTILVKRKLLYDLMHHLKASEQLASIAICATPTGPDRNRMTEVNINRMRTLEALRELFKPCTKCSEDTPNKATSLYLAMSAVEFKGPGYYVDIYTTMYRKGEWVVSSVLKYIAGPFSTGSEAATEAKKIRGENRFKGPGLVVGVDNVERPTEMEHVQFSS